MTIYTPAQPEFNAAYTLTRSGFRAICSEIELAFKITQLLSGNTLTYVYEPLDFFQRFQHLLRVDCLGRSPASLWKLNGLVQSKLKNLTKDIESKYPQATVWPYTRSFELRQEGYPHGQTYFLGLNFHGYYVCVNVQDIVAAFCSVLADSRPEESTFYVRLQERKQLEPGLLDQLR